jgi:hypothetical protein
MCLWRVIGLVAFVLICKQDLQDESTLLGKKQYEAKAQWGS